jgi:hypothetical protein
MDLASLRNAPGESVIDSPPRSAPIRSAAAFGPKDIATKGSRPLAKAAADAPEPALASWLLGIRRRLARAANVVPETAAESVALQCRTTAQRRALRLARGHRTCAAVVGAVARVLRDQSMLKGIQDELRSLYEELPGWLPVRMAEGRSTVPTYVPEPPPSPTLPRPDQQPSGLRDLTGLNLLGTKVLGLVNEVPPAKRTRGVHWNLECLCGAHFVRATYEIDRAHRNGLRMRCGQQCRGVGKGAVPSAKTKRTIIDPEALLGTVIGGAEVLRQLKSNAHGAILACRCSCGAEFTRSMRELRAAQTVGFYVRCSVRCDGQKRGQRG